MKVEKDKFFIHGGKSAMLTMRRRPLADRSRLELWQPEKHFWTFPRLYLGNGAR